MMNSEEIHGAPIRFCHWGDEIKHVDDFEYLRGDRHRPTDLTCPQCGQKVMVKLSPRKKIADHFAHYRDSDCLLQRKPESVIHFNAKGVLARTLAKFRHVTLAYECWSCRQWHSFLRIEDYDRVEPELRLGRRRPDVSCLSGGETIGAAEVWHTNPVTEAKCYDLNATGVPWFEIPAKSVHPSVIKHLEAAHIASIDAPSAGILRPQAPTICEPCRRQRAKDEQFRLDENRAYLLASIEERQNWPTAKFDAVERFRQEEERQREEREKWEQQDGPARLDKSNQLIIPVNSQYQYRYWQGGQSVIATLAELNAPIEVCEMYAMRCDDLQRDSHRRRCGGEIQRAGRIIYCPTCRYFSEVEP